jgi:hypothetical protein
MLIKWGLLQLEKVPSFNLEYDVRPANVVLVASLCQSISGINPDRASSNAFPAILKKAEWNGLEY